MTDPKALRRIVADGKRALHYPEKHELIYSEIPTALLRMMVEALEDRALSPPAGEDVAELVGHCRQQADLYGNKSTFSDYMRRTADLLESTAARLAEAEKTKEDAYSDGYVDGLAARASRAGTGETK